LASRIGGVLDLHFDAVPPAPGIATQMARDV
jgi:hypothetical protein